MFNTNEGKAVTLGRKSSHTDAWDFGSVNLTPQPPLTTPIDRSRLASKPSVMTGRQTSSLPELCAGEDPMCAGLACFSGVLVSVHDRQIPSLDLIRNKRMRYMVKYHSYFQKVIFLLCQYYWILSNTPNI